MQRLVSTLQAHDIDTRTFRSINLATGEMFFCLSIPTVQAYPLWQKLRELVPVTLHWPLILGTNGDVLTHQQDWSDPANGTTTDILAQAQAIELEQWRVTWLRELGYAPRHEDPDPDRQSIDDAPGEWPDTISSKLRTMYAWPLSYRSARAGQMLILALLPTTSCWHAPAWLKFGNWNSCPEPAVQVRLLEHWYEQYGAEVVGIAENTIEFHVGNPPTDNARALHLAYEHFAYCPDRAEENVKMIATLAALLVNTNAWYFWWD
jgi:hypothetical protein